MTEGPKTDQPAKSGASAAANGRSPRPRPAAGDSTPKRPRGRTEKGGRGGLDPARYGDWEIKGLTSDF